MKPFATVSFFGAPAYAVLKRDNGVFGIEIRRESDDSVLRSTIVPNKHGLPDAYEEAYKGLDIYGAGFATKTLKDAAMGL